MCVDGAAKGGKEGIRTAVPAVFKLRLHSQWCVRSESVSGVDDLDGRGGTAIDVGVSKAETVTAMRCVRQQSSTVRRL